MLIAHIVQENSAQQTKKNLCPLCGVLKGACCSSSWVKTLVVIVLVGIVGAAALFLYDRFMREDDGEVPKEEWQEELLEVLREYEVVWSEEVKGAWGETYSTFPIDTALEYALYQSPRFKPGKVVMSVGEEQIYTEDFGFELYLHHKVDFVSGNSVSDDVLLEAAANIISDSITLQAGEDGGYVVLSEEFYDALGKDYEMRNTYVWDVKDSLPVSKVRGKYISAWFYNGVVPDMGLESAREYSEELITDLRDKILSGEMTIEEAGDVVRYDAVMVAIDPGIEGNAFNEFTIIENGARFHDENIQDALVDIQEGMVSEVLVGKDDTPESKGHEAYFLVAEISENTVGSSFEDWYSGVSEGYPIVIGVQD